VLLGKKTTVFLGSAGNQFILNGNSKDLNAEEIYAPLTTPVFGKGVVYDCPNAKLMDQKRVNLVLLLLFHEQPVSLPFLHREGLQLTCLPKLLIKGFSGACLKTYVPQFVKEVEDYIRKSPVFKGDGGICDISEVMAEITLYTAAGSLQGKEIREMMDEQVALLYRHLDDGFAPINVSIDLPCSSFAAFGGTDFIENVC
jgi:sterol 14-demethylase